MPRSMVSVATPPPRAKSCSVLALTSRDMSAVCRLANRIWPVCYAGVLTQEQIDNILERIYTPENLCREMEEGHHFWGAYADDEPVGYASAYKEGDIIWLKKLYVLPEWQGRGIGRLLADTAIGHFSTSREMRLLVNRENLPAQHFYTRTGFTCIDEVPVQMGDFHFTDRIFAKPLVPTIIEALTPEHYAAAKRLMIEYREKALAEDYAVGGAGLNEELDHFPGPYAPPKGFILLAVDNGMPCGCLALRPLSETAGEVMRMYVQPSARRKGIAELLLRELIIRAKTLGYRELFLDSLKRFVSAHRLYEKAGFAYCAPYDANTTESMKDTMMFMRMALA